MTRDSAGITIVENPGPLPAKVERWEMDTVPELIVGSEDKGPDYQLASPSRILLLPRRELLVAEMPGRDPRANTIAIFDSTGTFVRRFGRTGQGPGEFTHLTKLIATGDSIWIYDDNPRRGTVYSLTGKVGRVVTNLGSGQLVGRFKDHGWLFYETEDIANPPEHWRETIKFVRHNDDGAKTILLRSPGQEFYRIPNGYNPAPFGKGAPFTVTDSSIYLSSADTYEIRVYDSHGVLRRIIRRDLPPQPVTRQAIDQFRRRRLEGLSSPNRAAAEAEIKPAKFPPTFPALGGLLIDDDGNLWVQEYVPNIGPTDPIPFTIFGANGIIRAVASIPRFAAEWEDLGNARVATKRYDPPQVVIYRIRTSPARN